MSKQASVGSVIFVLQECRKKKDLAYAKLVYTSLCNNMSTSHVTIGNYIVPMFVDCGSVCDAHLAFNSLFYRKEHSFTSLISGYNEHGQSQDVFKLYYKMHEENVGPSSYTLIALLRACSQAKDVEKGRQVHMEIIGQGLEADLSVSNTLIDMYAKCKESEEASKVFDKLTVRDVVTWTAIIAGYAENGLSSEALNCFQRMQEQSESANAITFICSLKACGNIASIDKGRHIHIYILQSGLEGDLLVANSLINMYVKCSSPTEARTVFDKLCHRDIISWNALITGFAENGLGMESLECFEQMQDQGLSPDAITFIGSLKACASIKAIDKGREIHMEISQQGFEKDLFIGNALVDMYANMGLLKEAQDVFHKMVVRDIVSWNTLISGFTENGHGQEALNCFEQMQLSGISPNDVTFLCILKACASIGYIDKGREIGIKVGQKGSLLISTTLLDMYAKGGFLIEAQAVFDSMPVRSSASWNAMIRGYGMNHEAHMAVKCFGGMCEQGIKPDPITFMSLLTACSRAGLLFQGQEYFRAMREEFGIPPTIDHFTCMIDLLARSGHLHEARQMVETVPYPPSKDTWIVLLSACKNYGEPELGLRCFEELIQIHPNNAAAYALMTNIYASLSRWDDANRIEELRKCARAPNETWVF